MKALAAPLLVAFLALVVSGCANEDVGVPCQLPGVTPGTTPGTGTGSGALQPIVVTNALDCLSRLCVRPGTTDPGVKPLCTKLCDSDDDCPDSGDTCPKGERFVCEIIQVTGGLKYCKMCVCQAFLTGERNNVVPAGVEPNCPKL